MRWIMLEQNRLQSASEGGNVEIRPSLVVTEFQIVGPAIAAPPWSQSVYKLKGCLHEGISTSQKFCIIVNNISLTP